MLSPYRLAAAALFFALPVQAGTYDLTVETAEVTVGGSRVEKMTINGGVPGPTLRLREGEAATITVTNRTGEATSVHWHGIMLPGIMDGSPGFNGFMGIAPGASYTYTFDIRQSGTYWYHSHSGTQDQSVLGAIVIEPAAPSPVEADRDYVVLLGDITPEDSDRVLRNLKADPGYYNYNKRTLIDFFRDTGEQGLGTALEDRLHWGAMRMDPTDLADVTGYEFLVNGKAPEENETFVFKKGERIRLRIINGSAMTLFDVRIPGLKMKVVAADGNDVVPVTVDEFRMGVAERYDVIVEPEEDVAYTLFAEAIDRVGYARATLATSAGAEGPIPERRPRALLSMADMGMTHDESGMSGMDHEGMDHQGMDHGSHSMQSPPRETRPVGWASGFPAGAKVLDYGDLHALTPHADNSAPARTIEMRLTGNMERYVWTLNGARFDEAPPVRVRYGERVRLSFVNETMMAHPMHLHGMFFELENGSGDRRPLKDTVIVPPGKSVSVVLTAKEVGAWPLHCHLLYHMVSGMMTRFIVEPPGTAESGITADGAVVPMGVTEHGRAHDAHAGHGGM
ncbi:MAG: multicopper oxidase domain-containing protein [Parvibaculum sp.]|uniref:multicopper oxidase domain-containing protein n=1 Tax=Parvibaculum sp. TaxID=2024848 RepID=UPI002731A46F|nr:multicopper oxidase domain-containing protein [Parvibaculum sp.]MDP1626609.1 multicopper oxidase domain-containing protein [Parvibaculum sp.]MDP2150531.1 multicopper oxidase domain-containing protein [Parvibaculum sp.]